MTRQPPAAGAPCPVSACLRVIGGKWKPLLLYLIASGCNRFGALRRAVPAISQQMLTRQLRELEADGLLQRTAFPGRPARVEYALSERGESVMPVIQAMRTWGAAAIRQEDAERSEARGQRSEPSGQTG